MRAFRLQVIATVAVAVMVTVAVLTDPTWSAPVNPQAVTVVTVATIALGMAISAGRPRTRHGKIASGLLLASLAALAVQIFVAMSGRPLFALALWVDSGPFLTVTSLVVAALLLVAAKLDESKTFLSLSSLVLLITSLGGLPILGPYVAGP